MPKDYKLALLKNEFGDLEVDTQLASSASISGVKELLNGCICCNLVGQLGDALETLRHDVSPDRIIIETSGSAFPATLAMEINRLGRETGDFVLDGVVVVIDVENWKGYEDTSYTAKMQAKYTDLIVLNKWEMVDERKHEDCLDRIGDLEVQVANVKSDNGRVDKDLLLGLDSTLARGGGLELSSGYGEHHGNAYDHQSEVEVLSVTLSSVHRSAQAVNLDKLGAFLESAPKDEIYRIKAIISASRIPKSSDNSPEGIQLPGEPEPCKFILNWAFGRWTFTPMGATGPRNSGATSRSTSSEKLGSPKGVNILRMTIILARYEAEKWKKQLETEVILVPEDPSVEMTLDIQRLT